MGAPSRRGEVNGVKAALEQLKSQHVLSDIVVMQSPATLDGGDVLTMEKEILVGLSKRTNSEGVEWLTKVPHCSNPLTFIDIYQTPSLVVSSRRRTAL